MATELAGKDPDYGTRKLYNDIKAGIFPEWTVYIVSIFFQLVHVLTLLTHCSKQ